MHPATTIVQFTGGSAAAVCPFCATKTAADIRELLFGEDFLVNTAAVGLPFAGFYLLTWLIYRGGRRAAAQSSSAP